MNSGYEETIKIGKRSFTTYTETLSISISLPIGLNYSF